MTHARPSGIEGEIVQGWAGSAGGPLLGRIVEDCVLAVLAAACGTPPQQVSLHPTGADGLHCTGGGGHKRPILAIKAPLLGPKSWLKLVP